MAINKFRGICTGELNTLPRKFAYSVLGSIGLYSFCWNTTGLGSPGFVTYRIVLRFISIKFTYAQSKSWYRFWIKHLAKSRGHGLTSDPLPMSHSVPLGREQSWIMMYASQKSRSVIFRPQTGGLAFTYVSMLSTAKLVSSYIKCWFISRREMP